LETDSLTVELTPLFSFRNFVIFQSENRQIFRLQNYPITKLQNLFHFFVRGVLTATAAEFLELQPLGRRLPVLRRRIIPLFAVTAL
jgi:hypothetical protein